MQQLCFWRWVNNLKTNQLYWGVLPHISRFYPEFFIICGFLPSQCNKWVWPACGSDMPSGLIDTFAQQLAHASKPNSCQPLPYFVNCQDFLFWATKFQSVEAPLETQQKYVGPHVNSRPSVDHICSLVSCTENYSTAILPWSLVGEQSLFNRSWIVIQTLQTLLFPQFWSWQALATRRKGTESRPGIVIICQMKGGSSGRLSCKRHLNQETSLPSMFQHCSLVSELSLLLNHCHWMSDSWEQQPS